MATVLLVVLVATSGAQPAPAARPARAAPVLGAQLARADAQLRSASVALGGLRAQVSKQASTIAQLRSELKRARQHHHRR